MTTAELIAARERLHKMGYMADDWPDEAVEAWALMTRLYDHALGCVDRVFQQCAEIPEPILPDFCHLGEDKFEAVVRLAELYRDNARTLGTLLGHPRLTDAEREQIIRYPVVDDAERVQLTERLGMPDGTVRVRPVFMQIENGHNRVAAATIERDPATDTFPPSLPEE